MTDYLLDTNVVSELRKGPRADRGVTAWFAEHRSDQLWLSALVLGELRHGTELLRRRDPVAAEALDRWLRTITEEFAARVLPVSTEIAGRWGRLGVPNPVPVVDGLLASTALIHDLVLVTRNVDDVTPTGVTVENPFAHV